MNSEKQPFTVHFSFFTLYCSLFTLLGLDHFGFSPKAGILESVASTVVGCGCFSNGFWVRMPRTSSMCISSLISGLGVVRSLSPAKIELAPAKKHKACPSRDIFIRPAERRTWDCGITMRAVAIIRTISQISTGGSSSSGVPSIGTKALIGTDYG